MEDGSAVVSAGVKQEQGARAQDSNFLKPFGEGFLKATSGVKVAACGLSSDGLVVWSEGKVLGILILNLGGEGDDRG